MFTLIRICCLSMVGGVRAVNHIYGRLTVNLFLLAMAGVITILGMFTLNLPGQLIRQLEKRHKLHKEDFGSEGTLWRDIEPTPMLVGLTHFVLIAKLCVFVMTKVDTSVAASFVLLSFAFFTFIAAVSSTIIFIDLSQFPNDHYGFLDRLASKYKNRYDMINGCARSNKTNVIKSKNCTREAFLAEFEEPAQQFVRLYLLLTACLLVSFVVAFVRFWCPKKKADVMKTARQTLESPLPSPPDAAVARSSRAAVKTTDSQPGIPPVQAPSTTQAPDKATTPS